MTRSKPARDGAKRLESESRRFVESWQLVWGIERFFNKIKHFRRIATRYDKLAENFLAALKLAAILMWLRNSESTFWPWPGLSS
jgi:transposase